MGVMEETTQYLAARDWFWLIAFVILMIGTGVVFYRLARRSEEDFFLAGRKLPWWLPAVSVYATHTATDTPIYVTGLVFLFGVSGVWYLIFPLWVVVSAFTSTRIFRRSLAYTIAEWQNLRFSGIRSEMLRGWFAGWQFFMSMFVLGWVGAAMGKVTAILFGWPGWIGIVGFASLCAIYVLAAGYWGVIVADFQQGIIAFILIILVSVWGILAAGGPAQIAENFERMNSTYSWTVPDVSAPEERCLLRVEGNSDGRMMEARSEGFFTIEPEAAGAAPTRDQVFQEAGGLQILFPQPGDTLRTGDEVKVIWSRLDGVEDLRLSLSTDGGDTWELISGAVRNGQAWRMDPFAFSGWFQGDFPIFWFFTMLVMSIIGGLGVGTNSDWFVEAQRMQSADTLKGAVLAMLGGGVSVVFRNGIWVGAVLGLFTLAPHIADVGQVETAWYTSGFRYLPVGVVGLFVAGIVAIHLSTVSTRLNLGAMYATRDLYHHYLRPNATDRELVWAGRISTLVLLLGSFIYGMMITEITQWLIFAMWIMFAGVWLPNVLQVVWWRFNAWGYLSAWVSSLVFSWLVVWVLPEFGILPVLPNHLQFWLLLGLGAVVFVPFTLLTKPEEMEHLVRFYVMTRPIGWWGPVRKEALRRGLIQAVTTDPGRNL
jgi:Na+/proline symporter